MVNPESSDNANRKELHATKPGKLFEFIRSKERELRDKLNQPLPLANEIDLLADTLEEYIADNFETMPEVIGESRDIYDTTRMDDIADVTTIEHTMRPITGNDDISAFEQLPVRGKLFGFHRGSHNELRAYVDTGQTPQKLMGGVYKPLVSLGLEYSDLKFIDASLEENTSFIDTELAEMNEDVAEVTYSLLENLSNSRLTMAEKLHHISPLFTDLATNKEVTSQFVDALIEIVKFKFRLDLPHTITTDMHRVVISGPPTNAHRRVTTETAFDHVSTELGLGGETMRPWLGMFFIQDAENEGESVNIQIPVDYITSIYRTES